MTETRKAVIAIRKARSPDEANLFDLVSQFPTPTRIDRILYSSCFHAKLQDIDSFLAVAECDGLLGGYVSGHAHLAFYAAGKTAWVDEIFVKAELRAQNIGRQLMNAFEAWAHERNCTLVSLATAGSGGFYERLGYLTKASYYKKYLRPLREG